MISIDTNGLRARGSRDEYKIISFHLLCPSHSTQNTPNKAYTTSLTKLSYHPNPTHSTLSSRENIRFSLSFLSRRRNHHPILFKASTMQLSLLPVTLLTVLASLTAAAPHADNALLARQCATGCVDPCFSNRINADPGKEGECDTICEMECGC